MVVVVVVVVVGGCAFAAAGVVDSIWKSDPEPERLVLIRQLTGSGFQVVVVVVGQTSSTTTTKSVTLHPYDLPADFSLYRWDNNTGASTSLSHSR